MPQESPPQESPPRRVLPRRVLPRRGLPSRLPPCALCSKMVHTSGSPPSRRNSSLGSSRGPPRSTTPAPRRQGATPPLGPSRGPLGASSINSSVSFGDKTIGSSESFEASQPLTASLLSPLPLLDGPRLAARLVRSLGFTRCFSACEGRPRRVCGRACSRCSSACVFHGRLLQLRVRAVGDVRKEVQHPLHQLWAGVRHDRRGR